MLRCVRGYEQSDVGLCMGIDEGKVGRIETDKQVPGLSEICGLLVSLQTTFEDLFSTELALAKADIHARIADYKPPISAAHRTAKRVESFRSLKASLDAPHGAHC